MGPSTRRPRQSKYRNVRTIVDNVWFASKAEAVRYAELVLLQRAGEIMRLEMQPRFELQVRGRDICTYIGDFRYFEHDGQSVRHVVEDVKGVATKDFAIKWKLVQALHPAIAFRLITKKRASSGRVGEKGGGMSETPDEPYDPEEDSRRSYALAINELRRQHLARDTEEGREDVGCLRGVQQAARCGGSLK